MVSENAKVWLITGSSTGFGRSLTEAVLKQGDRVIATARKPEQLDNLVQHYPDAVKAVRLDVTQPQEASNAVDVALTTFGRIDVLVNNAGYGALGAVEEISDAVVRQQFETNVFGALNVTRAVLPVMRRQRSGHILNISSIGGCVAFPGLGVYSGSKFALEGLSEALAQEVAPLGIKVTIVEPGAFRTDFSGRSLVVPEQQIDDYDETSGKVLAWATGMDGQQPGDPDKASVAMIQVVESDNPPLRLLLGEDAVTLMENKLRSLKEELETWKAVSLSTAFEGVEMTMIGG